MIRRPTVLAELTNRPAYTITITDLGDSVGWSVARNGKTVKTGAAKLPNMAKAAPQTTMLQGFSRAFSEAEEVRRRLLADDLDPYR
jgi:hypothetical protein